MSKLTEHPDSGRTIQRDQHQGKFAPTPDAREGTNGMTKPSWVNEKHRAHEAGSEQAKTQPTPAADADSARTPRQAAKGDDSGMSQPPPEPQQQSLPK